MSRIKAKNTKPEMAVRRLVYAMGFRYRLHKSELPGNPDLVFAGRRKVIFVHGCFWHRHTNCALARLPKSRLEFWLPKLEKNRLRDQAILQQLEIAGWSTLVIWECELKDHEAVADRIKNFLDSSEKKE